MAFIPRGQANTARAGEILLYRNGVLKYNYGDTRITTDDYGTGFQAALAAATSGDTIVCGPGIFTCVNSTLAASNVSLICNGTTIQKKSATNYTHLFKTTGTEVLIYGLTVDGQSASNTGTGYGIWVTGDRTILDTCSVIGTDGTTISNGDGSGFKLDNADDCAIKNLYARDTEYSSVWIQTCNRALIDGGYIQDPANRSISVNATASTDLLTIRNIRAVAVTAGRSAKMNMNISDGYSLGELKMSNCELIDTDMISAGYSYSTADGNQMIKFQNTDKVTFDKVDLIHGLNNSSGGVRSLYLQNFAANTAPEELVVKDCTFADNIVFGLKPTYMRWENNVIGSRSSSVYPFYDLAAEIAEFYGNTFNGYAADRQIVTSSANMAATDRYVFKGNKFTTNSASTTHLMVYNYQKNITTMAGSFIFDDTNSYENVGAGTMYKTNNVNGNLVLTTDGVGDLIFDDSNIGTGLGQHPDPGAVAPYFTGITAPSGNKLRIWNKNWSPDGTQIVPERGWIAHSGAWKEWT